MITGYNTKLRKSRISLRICSLLFMILIILAYIFTLVSYANIARSTHLKTKLIENYDVLIKEALLDRPAVENDSLRISVSTANEILPYINNPIPIFETLEKEKVDGLYLHELVYIRKTDRISANIRSADSKLLSKYISHLETSNELSSVRLIKKGMSQTGEAFYIIEAKY